MNYPLLAMMQLGVVPPVTFPMDSRYYGSAVLQYTAPDGHAVAYLQRRLVPQPGAPNYAVVNRHTVVEGDRPDLIAARYLGDPLMAWLVCDANGVMQPSELTTPLGKVVVITTPQGVPGGTGD
ncbi:LysM domain-containing protein [Variovorax sp. dw_954]|uniref:LysM domain-containing protein n=1 Tax=Variovorax sp. dw_954 TaxID=2720078 RepID=UPI002115DBDD|nr:LysM domain-containing protein [Variovorax sp. dw_954]